MHFLMGLNESYGSIQGQILSMDPFPSINRIFSLVVQEEKQREIGASVSTFNSTNDASQSHAFAVKDSKYQFDHKFNANSKNRIDPFVHIVVYLAILKISASSYMVFPQITRRVSLLLLILKAK